jgi:transposase-like protein
MPHQPVKWQKWHKLKIECPACHSPANVTGAYLTEDRRQTLLQLVCTACKTEFLGNELESGSLQIVATIEALNVLADEFNSEVCSQH